MYMDLHFYTYPKTCPENCHPLPSGRDIGSESMRIAGRLLVAGWLVVKQVPSNMKITSPRKGSNVPIFEDNFIVHTSIFRGKLLVFGGSNKHVECEC